MGKQLMRAFTEAEIVEAVAQRAWKKDKRPGEPETLGVRGWAHTVGCAGVFPPEGGAFIEVREELPFSKVLQPLPDMDPQIVHNGRFLSHPVPPDHGIAHAPLCFLEAEIAGPGAPGFASNFLEDAQVHRDHPLVVGVELADTFEKQFHL